VIGGPSTPPAGTTETMTGQVAIVTGGGSGIGLATARTLVTRGATVVVFDTDVSHLNDLGAGSRLTGVKVDVADSHQVDVSVTEVVEHHGRIDVLVNNAGVLRWGSTTTTSEDDWDLVLDVNLKAVWLMSRAVASAMKSGGDGGSIVNVASNMAVKGVPNQIAYSASKGGVVALTRSMAVDLGPDGIRVNCVNPGHVHTPMGDSASEKLGLTPEGIAAKYPLQRIGEPTEIAAMIAFLAGPEATFVTGAIVAVDGGNTA
jgi:3-oxoacyl-[acyl-carrier protein] reductase